MKHRYFSRVQWKVHGSLFVSPQQNLLAYQQALFPSLWVNILTYLGILMTLNYWTYTYFAMDSQISQLSTSGVPQGTTFGRLFFIPYINELLNVMENIVSYVDDAAIFCLGKTLEETCDESNRILEIVYYWMCRKNLISQ